MKGETASATATNPLIFPLSGTKKALEGAIEINIADSRSMSNSKTEQLLGFIDILSGFIAVASAYFSE